MKAIDVIAAILVVVGGLNWGLVGLFGIDLVATLFGNMTLITRMVYGLVGLSAVYQAIQFKGIQSRWSYAHQRA